MHDHLAKLTNKRHAPKTKPKRDQPYSGRTAQEYLLAWEAAAAKAEMSMTEWIEKELNAAAKKGKK